MPTFVPDEVVTAAKMNLIFRPVSASNTGNRTFTNTTFLDLDALTGGAGSVTAVAVSTTTGTDAIVIISNTALLTSAGTAILGFRVSGATTVAASDSAAFRIGSTAAIGGSWTEHVTGLTAGVNVFELQARTSSGTGNMGVSKLTVIPV